MLQLKGKPLNRFDKEKSNDQNICHASSQRPFLLNQLIILELEQGFLFSL